MDGVWIVATLGGILILVVAAAVSVVVWAHRLGVVPMPSSRAVRRAIVDLLRDNNGVGPVTDLGSGWGGLARQIATAFPDRAVRACEESILPLMVSRWLAAVAVRGNLQHLRADIHDLTLRSGETYVCYLSPDGMRRLRASFERDLPHGGILVSAVFAMPGWTPARTVTAGDLHHSPVYVYEF